MSRLVLLHDKAVIEAFVRQQPYVHLFELGDLDDFFWSQTQWYGWFEGEILRQLAVLYNAPSGLPTLLANAVEPQELMLDLLEAMRPLLPRTFYTHCDPNAIDILSEHYDIEVHGLHWKMALKNHSPIMQVETGTVVQLTRDDVDAIEGLYQAVFPGRNFDRRMVQTGGFFGIREGGVLLSVAGLHVYSPSYGVAVLGNVATHPLYRAQGFATQVCAALLQALHYKGIDYIGLTVHAGNRAAVKLYSNLGLSKVAEFGAYTLRTR